MVIDPLIDRESSDIKGGRYTYFPERSHFTSLNVVNCHSAVGISEVLSRHLRNLQGDFESFMTKVMVQEGLLSCKFHWGAGSRERLSSSWRNLP